MGEYKLDEFSNKKCKISDMDRIDDLVLVRYATSPVFFLKIAQDRDGT